MSVLQILNLIGNTSKTSTKEDIVKRNADNDDLRRAFLYSYNKQIKFGIKSKTFPQVDNFAGTTDLKTALDFLSENLMTRKLTGSAAVQGLVDVLSTGTAETYEVVSRILKRDLDCGCGGTIANKVWKDLCPKQPQQLASSEDEALALKILKRGHAIAEMKADGARCFTDIDMESDTVGQYSRSGNSYLNLDKIVEAVKSTTFGNWVIDGELVYRGDVSGIEVAVAEDEDGNPIEDSADVQDRQTGNGIVNKSLKGTISQEEANNVVYQVWDIVPRDVYYGERKCPSDLTQAKRRQYLEQFVSQVQSAGFDNIELIEQTPVKTLEEAKAVYRKYVEMGYEGIILKCNLSLWKNTRSKDLVKFKEKIRVDLEIVAYYAHKKDPTKLGGITVRSACGRIQTNCGSGFTNTTSKKVKGIVVDIPLSERDGMDREMLYTLVGDQLIGQIAELECNGIIRSKNRKEGEAEFKLFLPIIKSFRIDKTEANRLEDVFVL